MIPEKRRENFFKEKKKEELLLHFFEHKWHEFWKAAELHEQYGRT